ncbi:hypothetical protein H6P81_006586 [Aristolochia fimbriata]|uniref:Aminotransferase-like plant mobile domain-containing protein n=1 Tax=Aristolochia fimbriata TaxID=158543 RepID=A0AAV7EXW5_ARIFI|nr:hypothetical protein H6P81_006586 [Aristolochia fimbriata]
MAASSVTLVGGLKAFDHTVVVDGEIIQTLALYMEGDASHMTYCPSGESVFGGHAEKPTSFSDSSRSCEFLSRRLATSDRVFFLPCPDSPNREDEAAKPETLALQRASWLVNKPLLPRMFEDGVVERTLYTPDTTLDMPIPFLFEWTTLLMGRCSSLLHDARIYYGIWGSLFRYSCDVSVVRAFLDAWSTKTNTLVTCQGELSITLMDMDRIFGLPIAGQFYDEISPMVAGFKEVRSTDLPFSCRYLFLVYHHLCRSSGSNVISSAAWVEFWFRTEDYVVPVDDPWAAWHARFGKDASPFREFTATERDVFHFLHVEPSKEDEVHLATLLSVWLSWFVFRSIGDEIRPMVFKVASYMATGVRFTFASPALACLYKGLGHAAAGWPSMAQWPYLYTWLAVYFHTHGEDLEVSRCPGMISFWNPSLRRNFTEDQACDLFQRLPVPVWHRYVLATAKTSFLVDERKKPMARQHYESLLSVRCYFLTQNRLESAPVVSAVENSDEDYDSDRSHPRKRSPSGKRPVGATSASKKRAPLTILAGASGSASEKKKARKEVPPASFPLSPPTFLPPIPETEPPTSCQSENPPIETVQILSSPEAPAEPQEEASPGVIVQTISSVVVIPESTEVVEEPAEITPTLTQSEGLPGQEVAPPSVVQEEAEEEVVENPAPSIEAVVEAEAPPPAVEEEAPAPAIEVPAIEAVAEAVQEEVPAIVEVADDAPAVEEASVVQDLATPILTSQEAPSQEFLSYVEGLMVQAWRDRIAPRMLSPGAVSDTSLLAYAGFAISRLQEMGHDVTRLRVYTQQLQTLREIKSSAGEKACRTSRDEAESIARNTLAIVSSKLEEAKATLGEVIEELSEAKAEEEDAHERLESARTKVVYLTTQAE